MLIPSSSMRLSISASSAALLLPSRASNPLSASVTGMFWKVGVNDEIWVAITVDVGSRLRMNDDLISPTTVGGDTWSVYGVRICRTELDSTSLWVVVIF